MHSKRYLFSCAQPLLAQSETTRVSIPDNLHKTNVQILGDADLDLLSHSDMSWGSLEDRYVPYEILIDNAESTTSTASSSPSSQTNLSYSLLDQVPVSIDQKATQCINESNWSRYALDVGLWSDDRAPVVKLRETKDILLDELEYCGVFTDRLIGSGKTFLIKSPENNRYILSKCVMRNMSLTNITMLYYHHYLQYIDLAYNYITNLSPLDGIPYLMYLNVAHNRLNTVLNFSPPWYLTYVNFSYNYVTKMCDISEFWSIIYLDLSHNAIETISGLQNLKYLKYLNLSYNLIECIENLDKLNIEELNLEGNCILSFKPAIPGYGINALSELRTLYLGYNKLSTLEFFKNAYSLRVIDLKFNRINDLMELSNFKGLIQEIDLTGNGCTKWPNYKAVLLYSIPSIRIIDGDIVSTSEKVSAVTLFASPVNLTAACTITKLNLLEQLSIPKIDLHVTPYDETSPPLVILTGPSAVKKFAIAFHISQTLPQKVKYCKWYTTKVPHEPDVQAYIFVKREEFNDMSRRGEFLAIQEKLGNSYGLHHNEITSLMLENKVGITQMDLHATIQMTRRYSNSKPVFVITKCEDIHRNWIRENFDVYTCTEQEDLSHRESILQLIKQILSGIIEKVESLTDDTYMKQQSDTLFNATLESEQFIIRKWDSHHITFQNKESDINLENFHPSPKDKELRVILDEFANIMKEDQRSKRKRHQARLLQRRNTLMQGQHLLPSEEIIESDSSEETLIERAPKTKGPEDMKEFYTELILKSRKMYLDHHENKPGFFSSVVLSDDYEKAFNKVINFIYELYTNHSTDKPKLSPELNHFCNVAIPAMVNSVADEIEESLSSSVLQRKSLLNMHSVTSWKELIPSSLIEDHDDDHDSIDNKNQIEDVL